MTTSPVGVVVIDKEPGPTSHDVVARLRRLYATRRVGHAGTLDPMATGVLVALIGEATKLATWLALDDKRYVARVVFGRATDSLDATGATELEAEVPTWLADEIAALGHGDPAKAPRASAAIEAERGRTLQVPPSFSAIQTGGVRAYARARAGDRSPLPPRDVVVRALRCRWAGPHEDGPDAGRPALDLEVDVGKGYYVRSLARDLGDALGVPATLARLRRTSSGPFTAAEATGLEVIAGEAEAARQARLLPIEVATRRAMSVAVLSEAGAVRARFGKTLAATDFVDAPPAAGPAAWLDGRGALVGIGRAEGDGFVVVRNMATSAADVTAAAPRR